jgi:GDPmannose 4,6-dehydratase
MTNKIALITGITGQDGSFLAEFLLKQKYEVHGIIRRSSTFNTSRLDNIYKDPHVPDNHLHLHYGDITDSLSIDKIMQEVKPDEIYHLAAQSHVKVSFDVPAYTGQTDALGTLYMLEAMRKHCPNAKFYNATTSELYGKAQEIPQDENTPFYPRSPYGVAKLYSYWIVKNYRESYNMFAVNGILFNHESERRGATFVTAKIVNGLYDYYNDGTPFYLGNLNSKRDWGYAPDYIKGMWLMLQQEKPEDFVLATGETHTIKEFIDECIHVLKTKNIGDKYVWKKDENGRDILWDDEKNKLIIGIDERYFRESEVDLLLGNATKAKEILGWEPIIKFKDLVKLMMLYRINVARI